MAKVDAKSVTWEKVEVLGKEGLFTIFRVDKSSIPEGWIMYEVRHSEYDWTEPVEIALGVLVNHMGTLLVKEPFELVPSEITNNAYLDVCGGDFLYLDETVRF